MKWTFAHELARYGPEGRLPTASRGDAFAYCARVARTHYENFPVATLLLPRRLARHFHAVYAWCRWADDLADEAGGGERALELLGWWRCELLACYNGEPRHPVTVALRETIDRFAIPQQPFLDLLSAFEQDQRVTRHATYEQLLDYCSRSANPVGRLVLYLCECHDERRAALSDLVCTALQQANFWQDVARDLEIGRVYLPAEDRLRFGYGDGDLSERRFTPAFEELMRFQIGRTRELFFRGYPLIDLLPADVRGQAELFIEGGLAVLAKIEAQGHDVWRNRPALARWEKGRLVLAALWRRACERRWIA
jgi:squalene synthase HpnC